MPPKAKKGGLDRNVGLENRLLNDFDMPRDMVFAMTREEQSAELERLGGRSPRPPEEAYEELFVDARQRNPLPAPAPAPVPAPNPAQENEDTEIADAPAEHEDVNLEVYHPMEVDDNETVDRPTGVAETTADENELPTQQQPPIPGPWDFEPEGFLTGVFGPVNDQTRAEVNNMPLEQRRIRLNQILQEQWIWLHTPPPWPMRGDLSSIPADLRHVTDVLPPHLQYWVARQNEDHQRQILTLSHLEMYRYLYYTWTIRTQLYNLDIALNRQILLDPLLSINPYVSQWLQGTSRATQQTYLAAGVPERYSMLQDNGMLIHIQNWPPRPVPRPVPEHLRAAEQAAMQQNNYTDYQAWLRSTARVDWVVWAMRNGLLRPAHP